MNDEPQTLRRVELADLPWPHTTPSATAPPSPSLSDKPPSDSPAMADDCQCGGVGWYSPGPTKGGTSANLIRCSCGQNVDQSRRRERLGDELGQLAHCTFQTFDLTRPLAPIYYVDGVYYRDLTRVPAEHRATAAREPISVAVQETCLLNAYEDARAWATEPRGWICFHGAYGAGKSHLAAAIAHVRLAAGASVRYRSVPGMLDAIKEGFKDGSSDAVFNDLLGAQHLTGWSYERLFRLVNERLARPTIITTNAHPDDLGGATDMDAQRLADRIAGVARKVWMPIGSYRRAVQEVQR
jgi:hypothetical protein